MNICVLGSGAWGTALAILLVQNGHRVTLYSRRAELARTMAETRQNPRLTGITLPQTLTYSSDLSVCLPDCRMAVFAAPSVGIRSLAREAGPWLGEALPVCVAKGIEPDTSLRMSQVIEMVTGRPCAVLSGPSHAEEVARGIPTGCVAAAKRRDNALAVQNAFSSGCFRVYTSPDVVGVELGGALKNVIALSAGISDGLGLGDNSKALLMTRGLTEMARLGLALGGQRETFAGLTGVGDLIVTCTSMHSRNRRAGILIGQGVPVQEAMEQVGAVVEGYYAARSGLILSRKAGVEMPILQQIHAVLYEGLDPACVAYNLMHRECKNEAEDAKWS